MLLVARVDLELCQITDTTPEFEAFRYEASFKASIVSCMYQSARFDSFDSIHTHNAMP
jgi:hypothetical protein